MKLERGRLRIGELHGMLSSRMDTKINNERARMHLRNLAEPLDAMAGRAGKPAAAPSSTFAPCKS